MRVFNESDLLVVECLAAGVFERLSPPDLAAVVSSLTFRRRGPGRSAFPTRAGPVGKGIWEIMNLAEELVVEEREQGIMPITLPDPGFSEVAGRWARGAEITNLMDGDLSAGEFVRNIRLIADLLKQISEVGSAEVAGSAQNAAASLQRGIVTLGAAFGGQTRASTSETKT